MLSLLQSTNAYALIQKEKRENALSHAYLLTFDDEKYLSFALKTFAKAILGAEENDWGEFDDPLKERISKLVDDDAFCDCLVFPKDGTRLSVDDASKIVEETQIRPMEGNIKIFLVNHFDDALAPAQNKLLKVLEEPPQGVYFLLGARTPYSVLSTVRSRTEKLEILPFSIKEVYACLARNNGEFSSAELSLCAAVSAGSVGKAEFFLDGGFYKTLAQNAFDLCLSTPSALAQNVKKATDTKYKSELISLFRLIFRDALAFQTGNTSSLLLSPEKERIALISKKYSARALLIAQEEFSKAEKNLKFNTNFPQCVEICFSVILRENREI